MNSVRIILEDQNIEVVVSLRKDSKVVVNVVHEEEFHAVVAGNAGIMISAAVGTASRI